MPIYVFACPNNHSFEKRLLMADRNDPQTCPECEGQATRILTMPLVSIQYPDSSSRKYLTGSDTFRPEGAKQARRSLGRKSKT